MLTLTWVTHRPIHSKFLSKIQIERRHFEEHLLAEPLLRNVIPSNETGANIKRS